MGAASEEKEHCEIIDIVFKLTAMMRMFCKAFKE
jgi:hypothetical protein